MSVDVGTKAPDFTLMDQDRQPVTLSAYRGRPVILAFFPAAFSGTCTTQLCTLRDSLDELNKANAQVFGISVDSFFTLKAFQKAEGLAFPLLCDSYKGTIRSYGVVLPDMIGLPEVAKRSMFVVDREGVVRHREVLDDARNEPDYAKAIAVAAAL